MRFSDKDMKGVWEGEKRRKRRAFFFYNRMSRSGWPMTVVKALKNLEGCDAIVKLGCGTKSVTFNR